MRSLLITVMAALSLAGCRKLRVTREDLQEFQQYYAPNNAILIVSGDVTAETLKSFAEDIWQSPA